VPASRGAARFVAGEAAARPVSRAARDAQSFAWRVRHETRTDLFDTGGDRAKRLFDECHGLAANADKRWAVIVEHALPRSVVAEHGCVLKLRRRLVSELKFNTGRAFFEACGLKRPRPPRVVCGRRYAHFLGVIVSVFTDGSDTIHVEFSATVPDDPAKEQEVRLRHCRSVLATLLRLPRVHRRRFVSPLRRSSQQRSFTLGLERVADAFAPLLQLRPDDDDDDVTAAAAS